MAPRQRPTPTGLQEWLDADLLTRDDETAMMRLGALAAAGVVLALSACSGGDVGGTAEAAQQASEGSSMRLMSSAFEPGAGIPKRFTCDGLDISPPLELQDIPDGTVSLVLVMDDPDAPGGTWDHWIAYDIPVSDEIPADVTELGRAGRNSWGRMGYGGPCPPRGTHRYVFTAYALDAELGLAAGETKTRVLDALAGHVLAEARLIGRYDRSGG